MQLIPLPGDGHFYCGPAAIASFTGLHPKEEVRAAVNKVRGRKPTQGVIGMHNKEVVDALRLLGLQASITYLIGRRPTLKQFVQANPKFCGIVNVTRHYIAVSEGMMQDNQSGAIYPLSKFAGLKKRVLCAIPVSKG